MRITRSGSLEKSGVGAVYGAGMARGDTEQAFAAAALRDGVVLERRQHDWLTGRGHLGLPASADEVAGPVRAIFQALGGDEIALCAKPRRVLPSDFFHAPSGTLIEVDEHQHFTSSRLATLNEYPRGAPLGFDITEYALLCEAWRQRADRYRRNRAVAEFPGEAGRMRQRAFNDALRDLAAPAAGHPPVIRVPAPERDGEAAYARVRAQLLAL